MNPKGRGDGSLFRTSCSALSDLNTVLCVVRTTDIGLQCGGLGLNFDHQILTLGPEFLSVKDSEGLVAIAIGIEAI